MAIHDPHCKEAGLSNRRSAQRIIRRMERRGILIADTPKTGGWKTPTIYRFNLDYCDRGVAPVRAKGDRGVAGADFTHSGNSDLHDIKTATLEPQKEERGDPKAPKQRLGGRTKGYEPEERELLERTVMSLHLGDAADAAKPQWKSRQEPASNNKVEETQKSPHRD